jgi:Cys-tRNA(Pro)/Cys-tRNA(Cys) deacylase
MNARGTPAIDVLRRPGVPHVVHEYEVGPHVRGRDPRPGYGEEAAAALRLDPRRIFKTLVVTVDDRQVELAPDDFARLTAAVETRIARPR